MNKKILKKEIVIFAISGLIILLFVWNRWQRSPNRDNAKLKEVQELCAKIPVFSGFKEVSSNSKSDYKGVDLTKHYYSEADFHDVKSFYSRVLQQKGWTLVYEDSAVGNESKEIIFKKGEFSIAIFRTKNSNVYNYAIDCVWEET